MTRCSPTAISIAKDMRRASNPNPLPSMSSSSKRKRLQCNGCWLAWIAEAQAISQRSLDLLRPTIRKEGSEIWADWNPESEFDPIDLFLRGKHPPADAIVKQVNGEVWLRWYW